MKLLTKELETTLPGLYSTEEIELEDKTVVCKFFDPCGSYTFYVVEGNREDDDYIFWGFVTGLGEDEWGYASLNELEEVKGILGLGIERDINWVPKKFKDIKVR